MIRSEKAKKATDSIVAQFGFFYGWVMLGVTTLTDICTAPGQTYGISAFNRSFRESLNLSDTQLTGAYMLGTLLASFPMTYVGVLFDRYGGRRTLNAVVLLFGLTCLATSRVSGLVTLFLAFLFLRMCGQGAMQLITSNTNAMWFHRKLGTASGIQRIGAALSFGIIPVVNVWLIGAFGWRTAYVILGVSVWIIVGPMLLILFRDRPEIVGLTPDGDPDEKNEIGALQKQAELSRAAIPFTPRQVFRTRAYWIMAIATSMWSMIGTGVQFNIQPIFIEHGFTPQNAAKWFSVLALSGGLMSLIAGVLADCARLNLLLCISLGSLLSSILLLIHFGAPMVAYMSAVCFGFGHSFFMTTEATLYVRYYGRAHLGKIRGALATVNVSASALGPFVMGFLNDQFSGYGASLWVFAALLSLMIPLSLLATRPESPRSKRITARQNGTSGGATVSRDN